MRQIQRLVLPLLTVLVALALAPGAQAGWHGLGGQFNADDRDVLGASSRLATVAGVPWTIWTERPAGTYTFQVRAAHWTGSVWSPTGPLNLDPDHEATAPSLADVGGEPWAAWTELTQNANGTAQVHVARWNGSAWVPVGGVLSDSRGSVPVVQSVDGAAHVVFGDTEEGTLATRLRVVRWSGSAWADVGGGPVAASDTMYGLANGEYGLADVGGVPHVAWASGQDLFVSRIVGGAWTQLGGSLRHAGTESARNPSIAAVDGGPAVAWNEAVGAPGASNLRAARWDGTAWVDLGGVIDTATYPEHLGTSLTTVAGAPWVAWAPGRVVSVSSFDGQGWTHVGAPIVRVSGHTSGDPSLVEIGGVPHVGYTERFVTNDGGTNFHYAVFADRLQDDADTAHLSFTSATASASEAAGGVTLTIRRTGGTGGPATVRYATADGTAGASDYTRASGTVTFAPGETEKPIVVALTPDQAVEGSETFTVALSRPGGDTRLDPPATATVTITDDDLVDTTISRGPDGLIADSRVVFFFEAAPPAGATFACAFDGAAPQPCTSPLTEVGLAEGAHVFSVRATSGAGDVDPTPATRTFRVDTVRPVTTATPYGTQLPLGAWSGPVQVRALATDPEPGSGVGEVRCAVDPAVPPQTASDLREPCPVTIGSPGAHAVYAAAVDRAGNAGLPAAVRFRIAQPVDTEITAGPSGSTTSRPSAFSFRAIPGGTYECRLDDAGYTPCESPVSYGGLPLGAHVFQVRAVSVDGEVDPTPDTRSFSLENRTVKSECGGLFPWGTLAFNPNSPGDSLTGNLGGADCKTSAMDCPRGSVCTLTVRISESDEDTDTYRGGTGSPWGGNATAQFRDGKGELTYDSDWYHSCSAKDAANGSHRCSGTASSTLVGPGRTEGACEIERGLYGSAYHVRGSDDARRYSCRATLVISPSTPLQIIAGGIRAGSVYAPGPGKVTLTASKATDRAVRATKRGAAERTRPTPALATVSATLTAPGAVRLPLRLSKATARTLKRKRRVTLPVSITFTPTGAKPTVSRQRLTLITPAAKPKVRKVKRTLANARRPPRR